MPSPGSVLPALMLSNSGDRHIGSIELLLSRAQALDQSGNFFKPSPHLGVYFF
jgi:hypothetical protein